MTSNVQAKNQFLNSLYSQIQEHESCIETLAPKVERHVWKASCLGRILYYLGYAQKPLEAQQFAIEFRVSKKLGALANRIDKAIKFNHFESLVDYCESCIPDLLLAMNIQKQILIERQRVWLDDLAKSSSQNRNIDFSLFIEMEEKHSHDMTDVDTKMKECCRIQKYVQSQKDLPRQNIEIKVCAHIHLQIDHGLSGKNPPTCTFHI